MSKALRDGPLPFYYVTDYELVHNILFSSKSTRDDKFENRLLLFMTLYEIKLPLIFLTQLNFKYYTGDR